MLDTELLRKYAKPVAVLDSCKGAECEKEKAKEEDGEEGEVLDAAGLAAEHAANQIAIEAAEIVQTWLEQEPAEGETYADVLQDLFVAEADANDDGILSDTDSALVEASLNAAYDYMLSKGVNEEDAYKLLSEWNADAAERVRDLLIEKLPDGDAADDDIDNFVFGLFDADSSEAVMDSTHRPAGKKYFTRDKTGKRITHVAKRIDAGTRRKLAVALKRRAGKMNSGAIMAKRLRTRRHNAKFYKH